MATFVPGGVDMFNVIAYAQPSARDIALFENNRQTFLQSVGTYGRQFFESVADQFRTIDYDRLFEYGRAVMRRVASLWDEDGIRVLTQLVDIQFPPQNMIRWIMTNPNVRKLYHQGLCEGYGDKYKDLEPDKIGHDHFDYQMVMHGMPYYDEEEGATVWTSYNETFTEEENSVDYLTMEERCDILATWEATDKYLTDMKEDPTSQYSAML